MFKDIVNINKINSNTFDPEQCEITLDCVEFFNNNWPIHN